MRRGIYTCWERTQDPGTQRFVDRAVPGPLPAPWNGWAYRWFRTIAEPHPSVDEKSYCWYGVATDIDELYRSREFGSILRVSLKYRRHIRAYCGTPVASD